jgi:hypothetical protein
MINTPVHAHLRAKHIVEAAVERVDAAALAVGRLRLAAVHARVRALQLSVRRGHSGWVLRLRCQVSLMLDTNHKCLV